jgi:hypothetical protein
MHNQFKIYCFCRAYTAQHVSGTVVPIIRSPLQLPLQLLVTVWLPGWTCLKLWNRPQLEARMVAGLDVPRAVKPMTAWGTYGCRAGRASSCETDDSLRHVWFPGWTCLKLWNRRQLEARPTRQPYGNQRLQRQLEGASDDGHNSARNMLSGVYATKQ